AFLVKMPAFPLHGWMPDGYRAMPIEVLMVFSGVLSKVGAYGFLAIVLPLYPQAAVHFQTLMLLLALASILYGSAVAFTETDARLIAGYSSIAQLGFITLGIFSLNPQGAQGALLQMVNHGLVVAPLLFIVALLAQRSGCSERCTTASALGCARARSRCATEPCSCPCSRSSCSFRCIPSSHCTAAKARCRRRWLPRARARTARSQPVQAHAKEIGRSLSY